MAERVPGPPRPPFLVILVLMLGAALIGGLVARFLPLGQSAAPGGAATAVSGGTGGSAALPELVRKASPAVVNIAVLQPSPLAQNPLLRDPFYRRYLGVPDSALQPAVSAGSGVIVDARNGLVVTNFHVVRNASLVEVGLKDGRHFEAAPVALSPELDLAVLRIEARDLPTLGLGDSSRLAVGDTVVAIGNPFGLGQTVTAGIISATDRPLGQDDSRRFIQTDAPINPGNSGGPLISLSGEVIGINSALFSPTQGGQGNIGIGFAIPSNVVKRLVAEAGK
jgi:S1-C subfamily serine protease